MPRGPAAARPAGACRPQPPGLKPIVRRLVTGWSTGWKRHLRTALTASRSKTRAGFERTTRAEVTEPSVPTVNSTSTSPCWPERRASGGKRGAGVDRATLVAFDPERDLAVLDVTDLSAQPLQIGEDLAAGDQAYAAGYPGDGPFTISPQRVRGQLTARGTDIYQSGIVERQIYSLRGSIRPGNSGGPLLDTAGDVAGVVFARSTSDADTGYALTLDELRPVLSSVGSAPISSGACSAG